MFNRILSMLYRYMLIDEEKSDLEKVQNGKLRKNASQISPLKEACMGRNGS
jgi:hypothetical protein